MHRLTEISLRWPKLTLVVAVVLAVLGAVSASRAPVSLGAHAMFEPAHPVIVELEELTAQFGGGRPVVVAWSCDRPDDPCKSVFDAESLLMAARVGDELSRLSEIARVASPAHSPLLASVGDELVTHRFVRDGVVDAPPHLVSLALTDPLWRGGLVSSDGRVGALILEAASSDTAVNERMFDHIDAALSPFKAKGFRFSLSGHPWIDVSAFRGMATDGAVLGAATVTVIVVCFLILIRSWQSIVAVLATIGCATGASLTTVSLLSWSWDPIASAAPTLVLVLGSADAVHYLTAYWRDRTTGSTREQGLLAAARETSAPCAMTAAASAAGLMSFLSTDAVAIAHFGGIAAAGVLACLVFTFSVLPATLSLLPDQPRFAVRESKRWDIIIARLIEYPIRRRYRVLAAAVVATAAGAFGLTRLSTDADLVGYWKSGDPTREGIEFVSERLSSIDAVEVHLTMPAPLEDGADLSVLRTLEGEIALLDDVTEVRSVLTILDRVAQTLGAPQADSANTGEVLAIISFGDATSLDGWLSFDHRAARISASVGKLGAGDRGRLVSAVREIAGTLPRNWQAVVTGPSALQVSIEDLLADAAIQSVSASSLMISLLVMAFLRSVRWGALAMIPNVVPIVIMFGTMGILGMALDAGAAVVAPIAIGIAVDDTIHFLHAYTELRRRGVASIDAVRQAAYRVGRAMVTTSGTLALGFLAMHASRFQSASNIGTLSAIAIATAFATELLVLPALIAVFAGRIDSNSLASEKGTS